MSIKRKVSSSGKIKYQAQVWYDNKFYKAKTFDQEHLAKAWEEATLLKAIKGELLPAAQRAKQRAAEAAQQEIEAALDSPLLPYAQRYVDSQPEWETGQHGASRNNEYLLVAKLLGGTPLRAFDGKEGAKLVRQITKKFYASRQVRSKKPGAADAPPTQALAANTVRLRVSALLRLLTFARDALPNGAQFTVPDMASRKQIGWALPTAHASPRQRTPGAAEFAAVLRVVGADSELGALLQIQDETGCRLGEVRGALGAQVTPFLDEQGQLFGGKLHLPTHKTLHKTQEARDVPLSLAAAKLLLQRKELYGDGPLFPSLRSSDAVCKRFKAACSKARVNDLLTKDFRRAFVNRNKAYVPSVDLIHLLGRSHLIDLENASAAEKGVQAALGHADLQTTLGYTVPELPTLARTFTATSRNAQVLELVQSVQAPESFGTSSNKAAGAAANSQEDPMEARIALTAPTPEVLALARALGTYEECFNSL